MVLEVMSRNIPNKVITCNDKGAPWITNEVKTTIKRNARVYRKWVITGRIHEERGDIRSVQNGTYRISKNAKKNF